jgi:adenine/guanine phosphoribosyltransferase-like PRPP-binding protein
VIFWFQAFAFKFNLYRYTEGPTHIAGFDARGFLFGPPIALVGPYKLNPVYPCLKAPGYGFNP